jgi:ubiquinone/menaquinone biosynthesis C-methylase UbiE
MNSTERTKVCSVEHAGALDLRIRKLLHNPNKILKSYIHEDMTAFDIGCGPGFFTIEMAKMVGADGKVVAVDLQQGMLEIVKNKVANTTLQNRVEFHNCPNDKIGLSKLADFILVFYMLHEVPNQTAFLSEIYTLLKPNGKVLIVEPKFHVSKNDFNNSIKMMKTQGFEVVEEPKVFFSRSVLITRKQ